MVSFIRITLLLLWLFAVCAPSVVTLFHMEKPVVVNNINEEEPQEQGKKTLSDEIIFNDFPSAFTLQSLSKKSALTDFYLLGHPNRTLEVFLPPPKTES